MLKKYKFTQYIPAFFEISTPLFIFEFNELSELLNTEFFSEKAKFPGFYRFSKIDDLIVLEVEKGKNKLVLGYVNNPEELELPLWSCNDENN